MQDYKYSSLGDARFESLLGSFRLDRFNPKSKLSCCDGMKGNEIIFENQVLGPDIVRLQPVTKSVKDGPDSNV